MREITFLRKERTDKLHVIADNRHLYLPLLVEEIIDHDAAIIEKVEIVYQPEQLISVGECYEILRISRSALNPVRKSSRWKNVDHASAVPLIWVELMEVKN